MCGFAGIVDFLSAEPVRPAQLEQLGAVLGHRGPDDAGVHLDPHQRCGLVHRRLAIIDLPGGKQPMSTPSGRTWIVYNGECYNFPHLRKVLQALGHVFHTRSDTEVVLHLYEEYGPECVNHIRGMFAFAIWDQARSRLFLARDRLGQKPLYYARVGARFYFASELKSLLQLHEIPRHVDADSIVQYLLLGYVPPDRSILSSVRPLPPAHTLELRQGDWDTVEPRRYWSLPDRPSFEGTRAEAADALRETLTEAVQLRLVSDVPLGAFLSGGVDSTIIVALMAQLGANPVRTCSIGFQQKSYNELQFARQVAQRFHCQHREKILEPNHAAEVNKLACAFDEPFADSSALALMLLSRVARESVTVALSGDGGDEAFGGYDRYRAIRLAHRIHRSRILSLIARNRAWNLLGAAEHHGRFYRLRRLFAAAHLPVDQQYLKWVAVFDPDLLAELFARHGEQTAATESLWHNFQHYFGPEPVGDRLRTVGQAMRLDGDLYLPGDLNTKTDRASMAVGLEVRCPFQDHKLLELAYSLPTAWRHNGRRSKILLRSTFAKELGPIAKRAKLGFGVPVGQWFRSDLEPLFHDVVLGSGALRRGYFYSRAVENLALEHKRRRADHGHRMWALLMLETWHRQWLDQPAPAPT